MDLAFSREVNRQGQSKQTLTFTSFFVKSRIFIYFYQGVLTFYQLHTYDAGGHWDGYSPMQVRFIYHNINQPNVINGQL